MPEVVTIVGIPFTIAAMASLFVVVMAAVSRPAVEVAEGKRTDA